MSETVHQLPRVHLPNRAVQFLLGVAIDAIAHALEIAELDAEQAGESSDSYEGMERLNEIVGELAEISDRFPDEVRSEEPS